MCAGTRRADNAEIVSDYQADALLPRRPWRDADDDCLAISPHRGLNGGASVSYFKLPDRVREALELFTRAATEHRKARRYLDPNTSADVQTSLDALYAQFARPETHPRCQGMTIQPAGFETGTINPQTRRRIGLHFDCWSGKPAHRRHDVENRICINLGSRPRWFIFLRDSMDDIIRKMHERNVVPDYNQTQAIAHLYMALFPNAPVYALRVEPGEAYIASTETLIHDGASSPRAELDIFLTLLGHFEAASPNAHVVVRH